MNNLVTYVKYYGSAKYQIFVGLLLSNKGLTKTMKTLFFKPNLLVCWYNAPIKSKSLFKMGKIQNLNDILLYKNDQANFFKVLNICSLSQFVFWTYLSYIAFTTMKDSPMTKEEEEAYVASWKDKTRPLGEYIPLWKRVNLGKFKDYLAGFSIIVGFGAIILSSLYTRNSIRKIILKSGIPSDRVTLEFFSVLGKGRTETLPLEHINAKNSRQSAGSYLSLQQKGRKLHFIVDMKGEFYNKELFDQTVGLRRKFH